MSRQIHSVCVYCASSRKANSGYYDDANRLGRLLAKQGIRLIYGGGAVGAMGAIADGALAEGGCVIGVLPRFMYDLKWGHKELTELRIVNDIHERKRLMIEEVDAIIALPGGSGTLEELLEAITWKRLGLCVHPIIVVNMLGFFDPLIIQLERAIEGNFMDARHRSIWTVVNSVDEVIPAIQTAPVWTVDARRFATV
ncbi:MAG: TIGR00730 family Rossman fold protein [Candidatus Binatia bacterium]